MFMIPRDPSFIHSYSNDSKLPSIKLNFKNNKNKSYLCFYHIFILGTKRPKKSSDALVTWQFIANKMPWNLMFLLGGGFAISKGSNASCLSKRLGESLKLLKNFNHILLLFFVCFFTGTLTEFTSNVGVANIVLPVIAQMVRYSRKLN